MNFKDMMQGNKPGIKEQKLYDSIYMRCHSQTQKVEWYLLGGVRTGELLLNGHRVSDREDEKVLETDDVGVQQCEYT